MVLFLNVRINCNDLNDKVYVKDIIASGKKIIDQTILEEKEISSLVDKILSK